MLNANISLRYTHGEPGWTFLTPTAPREIKFLRMAVVIRVAYRVIPLVSSIPIVAVILRGFRGTSKIIVAFLLLITMVFFFALFGRELFKYYGPEQGCNECLECEKPSITQICMDVCSNVKFEGCSILDSETTCNPNICFWTPPPAAKVAEYERAKMLAADEDDPEAVLAALVEPNGKCAFDYSKGGRCGANMASSHFEAVSTFDNLTESMLLLFDIVIGANWYTNTVEAVKNLDIIGMLYFILFFYITNYQFLRLFVCIIASNYELNEDEKIQAQEIILMHEFSIAKEIKTVSPYHSEYSTEVLDENFNPVGTYDDFSFNKHYLKLLHGAKLSLRELMDAQSGDLSSLMNTEEEDEDPNNGKGYESDSEDEEEDPRVVYYETDEIAKLLTINTIKKEAMKKGGKMVEDNEISALMKARGHVMKFVESKPFQYLIILTVLLSIAAILVELPKDIADTTSLAFLGIFVLEMMLKWFALGVCGPHGYFADGFCQLDFFLVMLQIFDILENTFHFIFAPGDPKADIVKGFRALRAARLISKLQDAIMALKAIMLALGASMPAVLSLIMCNILMLFVFSIIAIEQFSGIMAACNQGGLRPSYSRAITQLDKIDCVGSITRPPTRYADNMMWQEGVVGEAFAFPVPVTWATRGRNYELLTFDNIMLCYQSFYHLLLRSSIGSTMDALVSATNRDQAPVRMSYPLYSLFLILFQILLGIFVAQVVVGIIMTNLKMKSGVAYHTEEQLVWPATRRALENLPSCRSGAMLPPEIDSKNALGKLFQTLQLKCFELLENWKYQLLMTMTVIINCSTLASTHFGGSREWKMVTWWINFICLILFVIEMFVKIIFDWRKYFGNGSDVFDATITIIGMTLD